MRIATVCPPSSPLFLEPIEKVLRLAGHEVVRSGSEVLATYINKSFDLVWAEWAMAHAAYLSKELTIPLVVRCHRYEVWEPHIRSINWEKVALLLVGSREVHELLLRAAPGARSTQTRIGSAPLDFDLWPERPKEFVDEKKVGVVANFDPRKNPYGMLEVFSYLPPEFTLHIVGGFKDDYTKEWWNCASKPYGSRIVLYGNLKHEELAEFWKDKTYALSASLHETAGPGAIVEAAACGATPLVYEYPAAREFWGNSEYLWDRSVRAAWKIQSGFFRDYAKNRAAVRKFMIQERGPEIVAAIEALV